MATGETHESLSFSFRISRSWIGQILKEVMRAMKSRLFQTAIPPPTLDDFKSNELEFQQRWNFPNALGCLDGKHVRVRCPNKSGSLYYNYKDFFSIVLMALVGPTYKFMAVDIGSFGREGDSGSFKYSFDSKPNASLIINFTIRNRDFFKMPAWPGYKKQDFEYT